MVSVQLTRRSEVLLILSQVMIEELVAMQVLALQISSYFCNVMEGSGVSMGEESGGGGNDFGE